jgi:hypothetical protein
MVKLSRIILAFFGLIAFTAGCAATLIAVGFGAGFGAGFGVTLAAVFGAAFAAGFATGFAAVFAGGLAAAIGFFGALARAAVVAGTLFFAVTGFVLVAMVSLLLSN